MKASWRGARIGIVLSLVAGLGFSLFWPNKKNQTSKIDATHVSVRPAHVSALGTIAPRGRIRHVAAHPVSPALDDYSLKRAIALLKDKYLLTRTITDFDNQNSNKQKRKFALHRQN